LNADGQDIYAEIGGVEAGPTAQIESSGSSTWWIPVSSLADNASAAYAIYTGQNTTAADNPQVLFLNSASGAEDVSWGSWPAAAANVTMTVTDLVITAYPSGTMPLVSSAGGRVMTLSSLGVVTVSGTNVSGTCTVSSAALSLGTEYDLIGQLKLPNTNTCSISVNGSVTSAGGSFDGTAFSSSTGKFGGTAGFIGTVARIQQSDTAGTADHDYTFQPSLMNQAQEGNSGNSWVWTGTVTDALAVGDATYKFVRDMTGITVTVGALGLVSPNISTAGETEITAVSGTVTTPVGNPYTNPNTTGDFGFPFNILAISAQAGSVPLQLLAMTIVLVGGVAMGLWAFKATRMPGVAILGAAVAAGMLIFLTPVTNMVMLLVVIPSLALVVLLPQPFEAR
jgi:hypothetical protein